MKATSPGQYGVPIGPEDIRLHVEKTMRIHPRVAYQSLFSGEAERLKLAGQAPVLVPFKGDKYQDVIALVDWDHRLPSRGLFLRLFAYYEPTSATEGRNAFDQRIDVIAAKDKFPEFDVPDFENLPADEAYEVELSPEGLLGKPRLTSEWRREVASDKARIAVDVAGKSPEFAEILASQQARPKSLGGLEAVAWVPPCESEHPVWTVDVWYLVQFDGRTGQGRSLVVDLAAKKVVMLRDFNVRAGGS